MNHARAINDLQKQIFSQLAPMLGKEEAAVVLGSMTMKYFDRLYKQNKHLDMDSSHNKYIIFTTMTNI